MIRSTSASKIHNLTPKKSTNDINQEVEEEKYNLFQNADKEIVDNVSISKSTLDIDVTLNKFETYMLTEHTDVKNRITETDQKTSYEKINSLIDNAKNGKELNSIKFIKSQFKKYHSNDYFEGQCKSYFYYKLRSNDIDKQFVQNLMETPEIMESFSVIINDKNVSQNLDNRIKEHEVNLMHDTPNFIPNDLLYGQLRNKENYLELHTELGLKVDGYFMTESLSQYKGHECLYTDNGLQIKIPKHTFQEIADGRIKLDKDFYDSESLPAKFITNKFDLRVINEETRPYFCFSTHKDKLCGDLYRQSVSGTRYRPFQTFNSALMEESINQLLSDPSYISNVYNKEYKLYSHDCHTFCQEIRNRYLELLLERDNY